MTVSEVYDDDSKYVDVTTWSEEHLGLTTPTQPGRALPPLPAECLRLMGGGR